MKPHLRRSPGVPGTSPAQWWCTGGGAVGYGDTPTVAYSFWMQDQMNRISTVFLQQPPPKPLNRFQRWALQYGDWR